MTGCLQESLSQRLQPGVKRHQLMINDRPELECTPEQALHLLWLQFLGIQMAHHMPEAHQFGQALRC